MKTPCLIFIACFGISSLSAAAQPVPKDVQVFINNAELCEHAAGEFDDTLSEVRQREIERSVVRYCGAAQRQLKRVKVKYKADKRLSDIIRFNTNDAVTSFR